MRTRAVLLVCLALGAARCSGVTEGTTDAAPDTAADPADSARADGLTALDVLDERTDAGPRDVPVTPGMDAARTDAATLDAARMDAATLDAARMDATVLDAARTDATVLDAARMDVTALDAARTDAARADVLTDAARADAASDAARTDGAVAACTGRTGPRGTRTVTLTSGGASRSYVVVVPPSYNPAVPMPVVLGFHGFNNTPPILAGMSGLNNAAATRGFISVMPWGTRAGGSPTDLTNLGWNAGACCGSPPGAGHDDVQLTRDILDQLEAEYCVDTHRVYATGFSNGAMFTHRLACELADRIAAIAPVSGTMAIPPSTCHPTRAVAVLTSHGTADVRVPWTGGGPGHAEAVPTCVAEWAARDGCTDRPREIYRMGVAHCDEQSACTDRTEVRLCTIDGGTHGWLSSADYPTTTIVLDFLFSHRIP